MKEKLGQFFKSVSQKVFNKNFIITAAIIILLVITGKFTYSYLYEVEGTVQAIDGSKITVASFLTTQTVDIGIFQNTVDDIQVGDHIEINKNISGDVISVSDHNSRDGQRVDNHRTDLLGNQQAKDSDRQANSSQDTESENQTGNDKGSGKNR